MKRLLTNIGTLIYNAAKAHPANTVKLAMAALFLAAVLFHSTANTPPLTPTTTTRNTPPPPPSAFAVGVSFLVLAIGAAALAQQSHGQQHGSPKTPEPLTTAEQNSSATAAPPAPEERIKP